MLKAAEAAAKIYDSNDSGNNQDSMHLLVNPFQKAVLPVGFVSDRYQSSVVLRMAAIRSRGSKRLKPLTQRKLTENWMKEEMVPGFFRKIAGKISTLAANLDRGAETSRKKNKQKKKTAGFYLVSDFAIAKKEQISWDRFKIFYQFPFSVVMDTHIFTKIVVKLLSFSCSVMTFMYLTWMLILKKTVCRSGL